MHLIANSFSASQGRLWEQIPMLLQSNWNIHGHISPLFCCDQEKLIIFH